MTYMPVWYQQGRGALLLLQSVKVFRLSVFRVLLLTHVK